jgi:fatty acid desaturase
MTRFLVSTKVNGIKTDLQQTIGKYEQPNLWRAVWQLANTFIPYIILCSLMYLSYIAGYSYWIILCLSILAAGLLVRIFIFFHDPMKNGESPMDGITTLSVTLIAEAKVMFGR